MGTIFIVVLVKIINMNTTMNDGCTESSQKHKISVLAGMGKGSSYGIHNITKMTEQIVCHMLKVGHTGMHITDPQQHNVCGQLLLYRSGG